MVKQLVVDGGRVAFTLELATPAHPARDRIREAAEQAVRALPGVSAVAITSAPTCAP